MGPDSSLTPELIQAQSFTTAFRGYDSNEVRSFLSRVSTEVRAWRERAEQLESAWHSAEERAARPPVLDEDTLMAAVGEETASILRSARAAAADMRAKAAEEAERVLAAARSEAARMGEEASGALEQAVGEAEATAARLLADARQEADDLVGRAQGESAEALERARHEAAEMVARARSEAEALRAQAEKERQLTIDGATSTRDRILEDLARRKRIATVQIEQLRAGRERLIESYAVVRRTLEEAQAELGRADAEARAAADEVGRRMRDETEPELTDDDRLPGAVTAAAEGEPAAAETDTESAADAGDTASAADAGDTDARNAGAGDTGAGDAGAGDTADPSAATADAPAGGDDAAAAEAGSAVDELFARIRGNRTGPGTPAPAGSPEGGEAGAAPAEAAAEAAAPTEIGAPSEAEAPVEPEAPAEPGDRESPAAPTGKAAPSEPAAGRGPAKPAARKSAGRASRAKAQPAAGPAPTATVAARTAAAAAAEAAPAPAAGAAAEAGPGSAADSTAGADPDPDADSEGRGDDETRLSDADESLLQQRESAVVDLEVTLTRRLKRALQDEQNDVLDRLRNLRGPVSAEKLLPDPDTQTARYSGAAQPLLEQAAAAGAEFTAKTLDHGVLAAAGADVADLAAEAGAGIVGPLRRRLEQAVGADDDQAVLIESLGAAYREWKTQRIERLAGDVLAAAFSRGTWRAAPDGAMLRWIVEDTDGPCPDCDDDALAGEIPKGEQFPTGQHHPPAHSGCRCLLVPVAPPAA